MKYLPSQNDTVNDYIDQLGDAIAPLFIQVRACILEAAPQFNESIKWKNCLVYGNPKNQIQTVVGKGKISLIFLEGVSIQDDFGLLEGEGKKARTMRITGDDFNREALRSYVKQIVQS